MKPGTSHLDGLGLWLALGTLCGVLEPFWLGRMRSKLLLPLRSIGLASAIRIVQRHGGRIWADGHVGGGAAFYFTMNPKGLRGTI